MPKANQFGSTFYVEEGQDLTGIPEGYRLVGPGAPKEETDEKEKTQPPSEDKPKSEDSGKSDSKSGTLNLKK